MDLRTLFSVFATVFVAELGDKTQLATLLFAANHQASKLSVFVGAALALVLTSAVGVLAGAAVATYVSERHLHYVAGLGFIGIGVYTLLRV